MNLHNVYFATGRVGRVKIKDNGSRKWFQFSLCIKRYKRIAEGKFENVDEWIQCVWFPFKADDGRAVFIEPGRVLTIMGEPEASAWVDENGELRSALSVVVKELSTNPNDSRKIQERAAEKAQQKAENKGQTEPQPKKQSVAPETPYKAQDGENYGPDKEGAPSVEELESDTPLEERNEGKGKPLAEDDVPF